MRLDEVAQISAGGTPRRSEKSYWLNGNIPWVKISDIKGKYVFSTEEYITEEGLKNSSTKLFPKDTILFTIFATIGDCAILQREATTNQAIAGIIVDSNEVLTDYVYYYLKFITESIISQGRGVAQNNINLTILKSVTIPIPSLENQKKIIEILTTSLDVLSKREQQIKIISSLKQSIFVDMFGDPVTNEKSWDKIKFNEIIENLTDYHSNGSYKVLKENVELLDEPEYALMVRTTDLNSNNFTEDVKYVSQKSYDFLKKSKVYGGEIIINKIGSAGKVFLMPKLNRPVSLGMNQFMLRIKNTTNNIFVYQQLITKSIESEIQNKVRGAVTKTITKDAVRDINLILPPINLQIKYLEKIKEIEIQKDLLQSNLIKLTELHRSLTQKAFNGELFND